MVRELERRHEVNIPALASFSLSKFSFVSARERYGIEKLLTQFITNEIKYQQRSKQENLQKRRKIVLDVKTSHLGEY